MSSRESKIKTQLEDITFCISPERLGAYQKFASTSLPEPHRTQRLFVIYQMIQVLSSTFFTPIHCVEICLRNRMYYSLRDFYIAIGRKTLLPGTPEEWYSWMPEKEDTKRIISGNVRYARQDIKTRAIVPGDVISRLTLGTWVNILDEYPTPSSPLYFWPGVKNKIFPNAHRKRAVIIEEFKRINKVRNRLFHHEPIWKGNTVPDAIANMREECVKILDVLSWMSPSFYRGASGDGGISLLGNFDAVANVIRRIMTVWPDNI